MSYRSLSACGTFRQEKLPGALPGRDQRLVESIYSFTLALCKCFARFTKAKIENPSITKDSRVPGRSSVRDFLLMR